MQAVAAVGDVRGADVLGRREQVANANRYKRTERNLERPCPAADADVFGPRAMDVDRIPADADRVCERRRHRTLLELGGDILLDNGTQRLDAPRLTDVGELGQPVPRIHDVVPQL